VAVLVTFVRVVRPLLLRLAGALPEPLVAMPARATFRYKKKKDRREYIRVSAREAGAALELTKYPHEGAGLLASLTETTGLAELAEDVTSIEPGDTIGYLPYAVLMG
jgi:molybdopterin molybdotransferase